MKTKLLVSAAAVAMLMAGGVASAQNPSGGARGESPAAGAGGSSAGSGGMSAPSGAAETGKSDAMEPRGSQGGKNAQDQRAPNTRQKAEDGKAGKSPAAHTATDDKGAAKGNKAANDERMNKNTASDSKTGAESKTTGNAATSAKGAPPAEKRTQITSAIKKEKVTAVTNVNFNISVGARVPTSVRFYPVPVSVIAIYPEWEGYEFILVGGRYVIVSPETHEIVYILS
jgi:hypothetical protein